MPMTAPVDRTFSDQPAVGSNAVAPSGVTLTGGGTAPTVQASGDTNGKAIAFRKATGTQSYWQDILPSAGTSDYLQFSGEFMLESTVTGNGEGFAPLTTSGIQASLVVLTSGNTLMRDAAGGSTITGWTNFAIVPGVWYQWFYAGQRGTTTSNGAIKVKCVRKSDGVVMAQGSGVACNTGTALTRGTAYGARTSAGVQNQRWANVRQSDQAFDFLELPIPAGSGGAETFVSTAFSCGQIGDSTTDRSGSGTGQNGTVEQRLVATGKFSADEVRVNGLTGRPIELTTVTPNGLQQVDLWRQEGYDPGVFIVALGGNGSASNVNQQQIWISDMLAKIAEGPRPYYRVYWVGVVRQDPANTDAANFWTALSTSGLTIPGKVDFRPINLNAMIHNGRDETGLWQSTNPTEAHMTASGYTLRDSLINSQVDRPVAAYTGIAAFSNETTLSVSGTAGAAGVAAYSTEATLTAAGAGLSAGAAAFTTEATLAPSGRASAGAAATFTTAATLTAGAASLAASGTAAFSTAATLTPGGTAAARGAAAYSAEATLGASAGAQAAVGSAAYACTATLAAGGAARGAGSAAYAGSATLTTSAQIAAQGVLSVLVAATLTAGSTAAASGGAAYTAGATLAASGSGREVSSGAATFGTEATLLASGTARPVRTAAFSTSASLAVGTAGSGSGGGDFGSEATLTTGGGPTFIAPGLSVAVTATLTTSAKAATSGGANFTTAATLISSGAPRQNASGSFTAEATLTALGSGGGAIINFSATATLAAGGAPAALAALITSITATLTTAATTSTGGAAVFSTTATLLASVTAAVIGGANFSPSAILLIAGNSGIRAAAMFTNKTTLSINGQAIGVDPAEWAVLLENGTWQELILA